MKNNTMLWLAGGLLAFMMMTPGNPIMTLFKARGLRNNNPGNIRYNSANNWQGQTGKDDKGFVIFDSAENGLRALARLLGNKVKTGRYSIASLIAQYAPSSENNTAAYVASVSQRLQLSANATLRSEHLPNLIDAVITHENGKNPYSAAMISQSINAAVS